MLLFFLLPFLSFSQSLTGVVFDKKNNQPIESAAIYFDNTTIGTATNLKGEFTIEYRPSVKSPLVISFLGYKDVIITEYSPDEPIKIFLEEAIDDLDEVVINYDDGLTRKQKLRLFRQEFLGNSKFGKSCKILNEDDIFLKYDKSESKLYASSKNPIQVENKKLQYSIRYNLIDFEIGFRYVDPDRNEFNVSSMYYTGTTFYKNLKSGNTGRTEKLRQNVYEGSVQHFMRSLYNKRLNKDGYSIFYRRRQIDPWKALTVEDVENSDWKKVSLSNTITILYDKSEQSKLQLKSDYFYVDKYGNYSPIPKVLFGGDMGNQRLGDALPSDFKPQ